MEGILRRAKEQGIDVFVFTCHVNYTEQEVNQKGAYNIMNLPDIASFDGAVLLKNSIQYVPIADELVERILKSGVPAVSIDEYIEGMHNIGVESYAAQRKIVEHLIEDHGIRKINYVTGIVATGEAKDRYQAYVDVLGEHGIPFEQERVYYGNYTAESGREAVLEFLRRDKNLPEAIVFANDGMAIGGISQLEELGYHMPQDVAVTGFDDDEMASYINPALTTINRRQEEIGYLAVQILEKGETGSSRHFVETELVKRNSCGCAEGRKYSGEELRRHYVAKDAIMQKVIDEVKCMALELAGLEAPGELYRRLQKFVARSDMESFYLCMCDESRIFRSDTLDIDGKIDILNVNANYTDEVSAPVAYENGKFVRYGAFPKKQILPRQAELGEPGDFYIVTPIYYQNGCFGYTVGRNTHFALQSELAYSWNVNIGIALENIRKWKLMQQLVDRLNAMWMYDMLTHIHNRSGFFYYSAQMLEDMKKQKKRAFIIFIDLDGLKKINDTLGHEYGDACICEMAEVIKECMDKKALFMRYGGDEFVIFGSCAVDAEVKEHIQNIKNDMDVRNRRLPRSYTIAASIGFSTYQSVEIDNLSGLIEQADKKMYEEKKKKHSR